MVQRNLSRPRAKQSSRHRNTSLASKSMLYLGISIQAFALVYIIANYSKADAIVHIWLPFMVAGIILVFFSLFIRPR